MFNFDLTKLFGGVGKGAANGTAKGLASWTDATTVKPAGDVFTQGLDGSIHGLNIKDQEALGSGISQLGGAFGGGQAPSAPVSMDSAGVHAASEQEQAKLTEQIIAAQRARHQKQGAFG